MTKDFFPIQNWTIAVEKSDNFSLEILQVRGSKQQVQKKISSLLDENDKSRELLDFDPLKKTQKSEIGEDGNKLYALSISYLSGCKVYEVKITAVPYEQPTMLD